MTALCSAFSRLVVQNVEAPAEGSQHEIVFASLDVDVAHGDGRDSALEFDPVLAPVDRETDARVCVARRFNQDTHGATYFP